MSISSWKYCVCTPPHSTTYLLSKNQNHIRLDWIKTKHGRRDATVASVQNRRTVQIQEEGEASTVKHQSRRGCLRMPCVDWIIWLWSNRWIFRTKPQQLKQGYASPPQCHVGQHTCWPYDSAAGLLATPELTPNNRTAEAWAGQSASELS